MKQIIHIFCKDVRRHWMEISLCQAALVFFCWREVRSWQSPGFERAAGTWSIGFWAGVLLPLSWGLLIFRAVQGESLVGDREFWITRPYEWKKLLAAKTLFVFAFVTLPLLVAQAILLAEAGFSPASHLLGLVWMQLLLIQLPLLPLGALAAVTRNLAQGLLSVVVVLVYVMGMAVFGNYLDEGAFSSGDLDWLAAAMLVLAVVGALWVQYSQRRTWLARAWLAGGAVTLTLVAVVETFLNHGERAYALPAPGQASFFHASLDEIRTSKAKAPVEREKPVEIQVPIVFSNGQQDSFVHIRGVMLILESPDGFKWHSGWNGYYELLQPGENRLRQDFTLKYSAYERMRNTPLKATVLLALDVFHDESASRTSVSSGDFFVPGVGRCRVDAANPTVLNCRSPLLKPGLVVARVDRMASTCPAEEDDDHDKEDETSKLRTGVGYSWEWGSDSDLAEYGVSPVESFFFGFYGPQHVSVCPGTSITFSFPRLTQRTRVEFQAVDLKLDDFRSERFFLLRSLRIGK